MDDNKTTIKKGPAMERAELVDAILREIKGDFAAAGVSREIGLEAYDMGVEYAETRRFNNSSRYHNYRYIIEDGTSVSASSFYSIFTTRMQTPAYMQAEEHVRKFFADDDETLFHLVRDQRFGINGVFKAVMSPRETQQLNLPDYVLVIACFAAGFLKGREEAKKR